ncbi:hypothetical protein [Deinococcus radiophilus]|uniref:hypothetical protein n=1 Tax=Deinococcus radiophilus TaxID=32062 RepID=UPI0036132E70
MLTVDPGTLSSDLRPAVAEARTALLDTIVEQDDALMNRYLEGEEISGEELYQTFLAAVHAGRIYPVLPVSAETGVGLDELLHLMVGACARRGSGGHWKVWTVRPATPALKPRSAPACGGSA